MREITPIDLLAAVHPDPNSWIALMLLSRKTGQGKKYMWINTLFPNTTKRVPVAYAQHYWVKRWDVPQYLKKLSHLNKSDSDDIYYTIARYNPERTSRVANNVLGLNALYADFDEENDASKAFVAGDAWEDIPSPNYIVTTSPNRYQCIWKTGEEIGPSLASNALRYLVDKVQADPMAKDVSRVLRLPGFVNNKRKHVVTAVDMETAPLPLSLCMEYSNKFTTASIEDRGSSKTRQTRQYTTDRDTTSNVTLSREQITERAKERWKKAVDKHGDGCRGDYAAACYLAYHNFPDEEIIGFLNEIHPSKSSTHTSTARRAIEAIERRAYGNAVER